MPYTNFKHEISKWLEKLRKSTKNSVTLADIPTKFRTKHFLNTHQKVFTTCAVLPDSGHNEDETLTVAVRTHCMNNLCKACSMNKWRCARRLMRCSVADDLLKLCHDTQFSHTTISSENTPSCISVNIHTYNITGYGARSIHLHHLLPRLRMSGHIHLCPL